MIYFCKDQQMHSDSQDSRNATVGPYKNKSLHKCEKLFLYTCTSYFTFSTCYISSHILHKKSPFRHGIAPNVFPFHACRAYSNSAGNLVTQPKQRIELCKHRAHEPLLWVEKLHRGPCDNQNVIVQMVKHRERFQVYNNADYYISQ